MDVFLNLQSLLNLVLKFRVTHYFKSVIRTIFIEYNKSFAKKPTLHKKKHVFFYGKNPAQWVKWVYTWVHTQANPEVWLCSNDVASTGAEKTKWRTGVEMTKCYFNLNKTS